MQQKVYISIVIPGNGRSLTEVPCAFSVTIRGDAFHLFHTLVMKYTDKLTTTRNIKPKNILKEFSLTSWLHLKSSSYRSNLVIFPSPIYFKPCNVVFSKYWLQLSRNLVRKDRFTTHLECFNFMALKFFFLWRTSTCNRGSNIFHEHTILCCWMETFNHVGPLLY